MILNKEFEELFEEVMSVKITEDDSEFYNISERISLTKEQISSFTNEKLCALVASNRYLKINAEMEILCMEEIANRINSGDSFNFSKEIESVKSNFIPIDTVIPDAISMVSSILRKNSK